MIDAYQIRSARAFLKWSRDELCKLCNISVPTLRSIEDGKPAREKTLSKIKDVLEKQGLEFLPQSGLRKKIDVVSIYEGNDYIDRFLDNVYETAMRHGGEIIVSNVDEKKFIEDRTPEAINRHSNRMLALDNVSFKVLIGENDVNPNAEDYIDYRRLPDTYFSSVPFYIYGTKLAVMLWTQKRIIVIDDPDLASSYRKQFDALWQIVCRSSE